MPWLEVIRQHPDVDDNSLAALEVAVRPLRETVDRNWPRPQHMIRAELLVILNAQLVNPASG